MVFSGIPFLYYFLPAVLLIYFASPRKLKNAVLLAASLVFYAWGEPKYVILLVSEIGAVYVSGIMIDRTRGKNASKIWLAAAAVFAVLILCCFKYADFFITNFNTATGISLPLLRIGLPVGISFYTFQMLSYVIDIYRGDIPPQKNPVTLAAYISMFPQLVAGPIVRYSDVRERLEERHTGFDDAAEGAEKFIIGLSKKVLIANQLAELCDIFRMSQEPSVMFYWLYAVSFTLYIYFDFSGYSDMAIGLGRILGFRFKENFNYPYISKSITEFWRRWHISLGSWFRDYVYIPLGGNRCSKARWLLNIFVVWCLTGLWHGAEWTFAVWGLGFAVILSAEKMLLSGLLEKAGAAAHFYTMLTVILGFVIFNAADMGQAVSDIYCMFGGGNLPAVSGEAIYYLKSYFVVIVIAVIGATPLPARAAARIRSCKSFKIILRIAEPAAVAALLVLVTAYLADGSFNPFLYFRF